MKAVEIKKTGGPEVLELKDINLDKPGLTSNNRTKSYWLKLYRYLSQIRSLPIKLTNWYRFRRCRYN
jgi:hypothetical protein